jgi:enterochelin esterase-like enzyme
MLRSIRTAGAIAIAICLASATAEVQQPQVPDVRSPVVAADGRVTFSVYAPKAASVALVSGEIDRVSKDARAMTKDERGVWSVTTSPLPPGIYDYVFEIDGVRNTDPASPNVFGNLRGSRGYVEVPGPAGHPRHDEWRDVLHGAVTAHWYESKVTSTRRRVHVYTPPDYFASSHRYPVLYLLHGAGDNDSHWSVFGRANVIADNLIADRRAEPMLIVMPDGHPYEIDPKEPRETRLPKNAEGFEADLLQEVVPLVERTYRVRREATARAIAGLSMGGGQSLYVSLRHPDRFGWVGAFSSAPWAALPLVPALKQDPRRVNEAVRLLWIRIGKDDFLMEPHAAFVASLKEAGIRHDSEVTEGAHMWSVWRSYLTEFLPLVFRSATSSAAPATPGARPRVRARP